MNEPGAGCVVIVEDDAPIADLVTTYLRREGFRTVHAADGDAGLNAVRIHRPDLVLLDVGLPGDLDGLELCRLLRHEHPQVPIVMVTARGDEIDRVLGLELGADDYVTKPFSPRELVARVKAVLRRARATAAPPPTAIELGQLRLDPARREVTAAGEAVELTTREFDLLRLLLEHRGIVLSRRQILDGAWAPGWYGDERTVDVHVRQLRRKLDDLLPLETIRGVGYRLG